MMNAIKAELCCAHPRMGKKGLELSINFIVMLILAVVVFGFGLYFAGRVFSEAKEASAFLDRDSEQQITRQLDRGAKVAFPVTSRTIKADELAVFGLGIMNVLQEETTFDITLQCSAYVNNADNPDDSKCEGKWAAGDLINPGNPNSAVLLDTVALIKHEQAVIPIGINPPGSKPDGVYAFIVTVTNRDTGEIYGGSPKQIYVTID